MAEVEILLGTRNGARFLGAQLASFAGQSLRNWTLLVSDDGSRDNTRAVLERFGNARPGADLRLLAGPQLGVSANYLSLLQNADPYAKFVALSDQDDIWFPEKLRRGVDALQRLPQRRPAIYAAQSTLIGSAGQRIPKRKPAAVTPSFRNALVQNVCAGNTIILNRAAADLAARAIPTSLPPFHDWWLYGLMAGAGAEIVIDRASVLAYRQHAGGLLGAHAGMMARAARLRMVADGTWRDWLNAHHKALSSVSTRLLPEHRADLQAFSRPRSRGNRIRLIGPSGIRRQALSGTAALCVATLFGLA